VGSGGAGLDAKFLVAGPWLTVPSVANREPWQGQSQVSSAGLNATVHPKKGADGRDGMDVPGGADVDGGLLSGDVHDASFARGEAGAGRRCIAQAGGLSAEVLLRGPCRAGCRGVPGAVKHRRPRVVPAAEGAGEHERRGRAVGQAPLAQTGDHVNVPGRRRHEPYVGQPVESVVSAAGWPSPPARA
jgi:hypothetical protein